MSKSNPVLIAWLVAEIASGHAKAARLALGLSLSEMAAPLGVDQSTVWRWEEGMRRPRGERAYRYANLLKALEGEMARHAA